MSDTREMFTSQRVSMAEKDRNDKQWYKDKIRVLDAHSNKTVYGFDGISEYHRMKVNYDLFNDKIDLEDFSYVCKPFGATMGELPARMVNRDIVSVLIINCWWYCYSFIFNKKMNLFPIILTSFWYQYKLSNV